MASPPPAPGRLDPADAAARDAALEAAWAGGDGGRVLEEAERVAPALPLPRMIEWSSRLRAAGRARACPLVSAAGDPARPAAERALAAASAWALARDPRGSDALRRLLGGLAAIDLAALQPLVPDLVEPLPGYYLHARPEILERIPTDARTLLELGCAAGVLGQSVKDRQHCRYVGVEREPAAARLAANTLDEVAVLDLDAAPLPYAPGTFDCVVCADVLEHLSDPWAVLAAVFAALRPGGRVVVSIPNIRNLGVLAEIAAGDWVYRDAGILDRTHLRFFTRRSFERALLGAGFEIRSENCVFDPSLQAAVEPGPGGVLRARRGQLQLEGLSADDALELATVQFLFVADRP